MFSFPWTKRTQVARLICRLFNEPTMPTKGSERRTEERTPRIRPVVLVPRFDGQPGVSEAQFAMTSDITSRGLSAYIPQPMPTDSVYVGFHFDGQGHLIVASVKSAAAAGGGFHRIGLEFIQIADNDEPGIEMLRSLTVGLSLSGGRKIDSAEIAQSSERAYDRKYQAARTSLFEALKDMGLAEE